MRRSRETSRWELVSTNSHIILIKGRNVVVYHFHVTIIVVNCCFAVLILWKSGDCILYGMSVGQLQKPIFIIEFSTSFLSILLIKNSISR